jgi:integrase
MTQATQPLPSSAPSWPWPLNLAAYDRTPVLSERERAQLEYIFTRSHGQVRKPTKRVLARLIRPIEEALRYLHVPSDDSFAVIRIMCIEMHQRGTPFWAWSLEIWRDILGPDLTHFSQRYGRKDLRHPARAHLPIIAYLLDVIPDVWPLIEMNEIHLQARRIFGKEAIDQAVLRLRTTLQSWGYQQKEQRRFTACVSYLLMRNRSPTLEDLTVELLETVAHTCPLKGVQAYLYQVSRALFALGAISRPFPAMRGERPVVSGTDGSIAAEWLTWCQRWQKQSTARSPGTTYYPLLKVGRWLKVHHPEVTSPAHWTYELCAEFVAAASEMKVGEWSDANQRTRLVAERIGQPLRPNAKNHLLQAMRAFLRDCQEWGWIPVRINPHRALRTPRSIWNLIGPDPRVVDKEAWAKLLWSAMNLEEEDLPKSKGQMAYPLEMVRAVAVVWCFAALRSDEIVRLRVGCIRWQYEDVMVPETGEILPRDAVCFLDIPINKTVTSYTKAVHTLVGTRINEWERIRPREQPRILDDKTSEIVPFLFSYRGKRLSTKYINDYLIPHLCRKAGIPGRDSRGAITSHRARATIASMLYNAKEPLDIFQLKEYLGHKQLSSTQHYVRVDPTRLARQVAKAGYLEQNLATIEVLLDQDAVMNGAAARGECWKYYDLGHGFCTNPFWAQCLHRLACARCPYYRPKDTTMEQLVEGKANLARMLEFVALTDDEKLLVSEGIQLHQELIEKLADVPTPAGPTPRDLKTSPEQETQVIPLAAVRRRKKQHEP